MCLVSCCLIFSPRADFCFWCGCAVEKFNIRADKIPQCREPLHNADPLQRVRRTEEGDKKTHMRASHCLRCFTTLSRIKEKEKPFPMPLHSRRYQLVTHFEIRCYLCAPVVCYNERGGRRERETKGEGENIEVIFSQPS